MKTQAILNTNYDAIVEIFKNIKDRYSDEEFILSMYITTATLADRDMEFYALVLFVDDYKFIEIEQYLIMLSEYGF